MWPTALWFVSGATTVVSPIGSSACFSASRPRDSIPSSLVTRIRGRVVQSPSGRAMRSQGARPAPRGAAGERLAPFLVDVPALDPCPLPVHLGLHRPVGHGLTSTSTSSPGIGSRGTRIGPALADLEAPGRPGGDATGVARPAEVVEEERRHDGGDRDAEDRADDPADLRADEDRAEDDDRVDPDGLLHEPRLEDVHHDQPADGDHRDRRQEHVRASRTTATRTGGSHATNGPKNGMAMSTPAAADVTAAIVEPEHDVRERRR